MRKAKQPTNNVGSKSFSRPAGSREGGGYRWMQEKLYARLQYLDDFGRQREKLRRISSGKISDVWPELRRMRDELSHHGEDLLQSDRMTFAELAKRYKESKVFPAVIRDGVKVAGLKSFAPVLTYVKIAVNHFGNKPIRSLRARHIEEYLKVRLMTPVEISGDRKTTISRHGTKVGVDTRDNFRERKLSSVNREMATLRRMLNFAVNEGWLEHSPFLRTENLISIASEKSRDKVLTFEEEARLLSECVGERLHLKPILICALDTAMRPDEIFKLAWQDVDLRAGILTVTAENTKTETKRSVGITPRLSAELERLREISGGLHGSRVFGVRSIKNSFRTACRNAEISNFRFRDCRHTATTRMVNSGMPQAEVMKTTGHTQGRTFLRYVNPTSQSIREAAERFGVFVGEEIERAVVQDDLEYMNSVH